MRLRACRRGAPSQLRARSRRRVLGAHALSREHLAAAAAAGAGVLVGAAMVATRSVVDEITPGALAMLRYVIGCLCLLPAVLLSPRARFRHRDLLPIALLGIGQFGILIALLNLGLQWVPAARAALVFATLPFLTLLIASSLGRERMTVPKTIGLLATLAGVALALGHAAWTGVSGAEWRGMLAVLASALCGAVCSVAYRPYLERYPTVPVSALAMLASVGFLSLLAAAEGFFTSVPHISPGGWSAIGFIGLASAVGYFLWLWALRHATPTKVTVFLALSPVTAAVLGVALLGEPMTPALAGGTLLVAAGLWIAHRPRLLRSTTEPGVVEP